MIPAIRTGTNYVDAGSSSSLPSLRGLRERKNRVGIDALLTCNDRHRGTWLQGFLRNPSPFLPSTDAAVSRLVQLKRRGDKVVVHALRGLPSNRKISADTQEEAIAILLQPVYRGFGPALAAEYLAKKHDIEVSRETVRQWMIGAKLWRAHKQRVEKIHEWRPRRSRFGELVQWDTSPHDWLEGRGKRCC